MTEKLNTQHVIIILCKTEAMFISPVTQTNVSNVTLHRGRTLI